MEKTMNEVYRKLLTILLTVTNKPIEEKDITNESNLKFDLGLDSMAMVNLQVSIEDEFEFRFDPIETDLVEVFTTVGSLYSHLASITS